MLRSACVAMKHRSEFPSKGLDGGNQVIPTLPIVQDHIEPHFYGKLQLKSQNPSLVLSPGIGIESIRRCVKVVQPDFTDGYDFGVRCKVTKLFDPIVTLHGVCIAGMNACRHVKVRVLITEPREFRTIFQVCRRRDDSLHASFPCAQQNVLSVCIHFLTGHMGVSIDEHA